MINAIQKMSLANNQQTFSNSRHFNINNFVNSYNDTLAYLNKHKNSSDELRSMYLIFNEKMYSNSLRQYGLIVNSAGKLINTIQKNKLNIYA